MVVLRNRQMEAELDDDYRVDELAAALRELALTFERRDLQ